MKTFIIDQPGCPMCGSLAFLGKGRPDMSEMDLVKCSNVLCAESGRWRTVDEWCALRSRRDVPTTKTES